ncbi:efflux RND transporter permease subunit [Ornithinicoccus hortensis]|uniref:HAE1 family hydrophobic/amphiphilic exporter-1 n=1 Tax=Ornithinicoccus hortensis TaxID=82346 RepID=A0A542YM54_9MICO|nr:efflux RND transporter permease subunit [Ornithinicoccus hortensis]TQL49166.1 HAE1 family hydrophobic/amphiphilic exporter-1 [Ornithinicoccus hortensis]
MSKLTLFSVRNRALIALATIFTVLAGTHAMTSLPRELFPSLEFPILAVATGVQGASAEVMEERVSDPIEVAAQGLDGVVEVQSQSSEGFSAVLVELDYGTDMGATQTDLQRAVLGLQGLPEGADPAIFAGSIDDFPIIQMSATGGTDRDDLVDRLRTVVIPDLEDVDGVREVQLTGVQDKEVRIDLDQAAATEAGVSAAEIGQLLQANGVVVPAGTVSNGEQELAVSVGARLQDVDELRSLPLPGAGGATLADVAQVSLETPEATAYTRTNGTESIGLSITKKPDGNAVQISHEVQELLPDLETAVGGEMTVIFDQAPFIEQSVDDLTHEGLLGLGFAILIVLVFLLSVRLTLVTAVSIPLSLLIALIGLQAAGYSLNLLTLGALTISIGRVVDDSIVVIENIKRHARLGEDRLTSVVRAVREVAGAITSATVCTVAVFLPMIFVGGQVGELFSPFALTVAIAMGASLLVSLTIVPVLGYWFLGRGADERATEHGSAEEGYADTPASASLTHEWDAPDRLQRAYLPVLKAAIGRPVWSLLLAVLILVGTGLAAGQLKTNFIGSAGGNSVTATVKLPSGATLEETDAATTDIEEWLSQRPDVEAYQATVGSSGGIEAVFLGSGSNSASIAITLVEGTDGDVFGDALTEQAPVPDDATVTVASAAGAPGATELEVIVTGLDQEDLAATAEEVVTVMEDVGAGDVTNNLTDTVPSLQVTVDRSAAGQAGLTEAAVGQVVAAATNGSIVGQVELEGSDVTVVVHQGERPATVDELESLPVGGGEQGPVLLGDVADLEEVDQPVRVTRIDGIRAATVTGTPDAADLGAVSADLQERLDGLDLPDGVQVEIGGVTADQNEAFASLGLALLAAIAIVYLVMVATFNSMLQPLLLMVSVPFAATGSLLMLLVTDTALDVSALIGMLMLIGIVVTNAIVLIDLVNQYRNRGLSVHEALIEGARHRFRPIVMTALATIGALTPMALALTGGGAFISQPLALVVIGGLISSTALTLLLVPVLYRLVEGAKERRADRRAAGGARRGLFGRRGKHAEAVLGSDPAATGD